jgi:hypothetical protein
LIFVPNLSDPSTSVDVLLLFFNPAPLLSNLVNQSLKLGDIIRIRVIHRYEFSALIESKA